MANDHLKSAPPSRWLMGAVLAGSISIGSGCHAPLRAANNALLEDNFVKAEENARSGLERDARDPEANLILAQALMGQKRWADAEAPARIAFASREFPGAAGRTYGKVLWELERPIEAVEAWRAAREADRASVSDEDYQRALERALADATLRHEFEAVLALQAELAALDPENPAVSSASLIATRESYAESLEREGNYEKAIEVYAALQKDRPEHSEYPRARGRLLATLGRTDEAIAAFDEYVAIGEQASQLERILEVAAQAERTGAHEVALRYYNRAIESLAGTPTRRRAEIRKRLAALLLARGRSEEGKKHLRAYVDDRVAIGGKPVSSNIYWSAADVATQNRHPNIAIELLEEAIVEAAPSWRTSRRLAELYARRAKSADVERVLNAYVERAEAKPMAQVRVGRWATGRRNFELARFYLESAVQSPDVPYDVWLELARVYSALGFMDEVDRALQAYAKKAPDKNRALIDVAGIYRAQRMFEEAEEALLASLKGDSENLLVVKMLEELYREWGRPKKIHDVYAKWAKRRGNKAEDFQLIGERFFRQQEWDAALPYLERAAKAGQKEAWLQVADIYNRQRKERDMKTALEKYLQASTDRTRALNAVLQRYRMSNWSYEAIPILEELVELEPRNVLHYEQLSQLYFEQGRDVEAFELWKRYISMSSNPIASLETMARRFQRRNHQDWMLQFLHQVLEKETNPDPRIYRLLGDTYAESYFNATNASVVPDTIFNEENKAKEYYEKYLEEATPSRGELQSFAESMRQKQFWEISAKAYEKLRTEGALQSHQILNYGIVLLNLGRAEEAQVLFADYYDRRAKSVDAALAISDQLFTARRYGAAEPYLREMLAKGDEPLVRQAFMRLAEVYWKSDRTEKIEPLVDEFLARSQNPSEARRTALMMLEAAGMWEEAAEQLRAMGDAGGDAVGFALGMNLFRAGRRDDADDAFREFIDGNPNPTDAWRMVGEFWEARGEVDRARNAFQNAANSAPQNETIHATLGRFQILHGQHELGRASFERARSNVPHGQRGGLYRLEVEALVTAGRFREAREVARDAVAVAYLDRDYFYEVFARAELESGDSVRSQRMVDEMESANLPLGTVVRLLSETGYIEKATELIDEEITAGDYVLGGEVLLSNPRLFTRLGGLDRLMRSAQPLIERAGRDPQIPRRLGLLLVAEGALEQGARLLRHAVELGDEELRRDLTTVYATLGHHDEAFQMLQAALVTGDDYSRTITLQVVGERYEVLGERRRFKAQLEHLARDARFAPVAMPMLIAYLVEDGEVPAVVDTVRRLLVDPAEGSEDDFSVANDARGALAAAALTAAVQHLTLRGYDQEAVQLLNDAPESMKQTDSIRNLRLRVAAFGGILDAGHEFETALAGLGDSGREAWQRLQIAELAAIASRTSIAIEIAEPLLTSSDFGVSSRALRVLLRTARVTGDTEQLDAWIATYSEHNVDRVGARETIFSELTQLGLDDRALEVAVEQARKVPIDAHVSNALLASQRAGSAGPLATWTDRLVEVHRLDPMAELENHYYSWSLRQDDALNAPIRSAIAPSFHHTLGGIEAEVQNLYRIGEPFKARERIAQYLAEVEYDPQAVEEMCRTLEQIRLRGDIARFLAPLVPEANLTVDARRLIGLANLSIGFTDDGFQVLDQSVAAAPDPAHQATLIAGELIARRLYRPALRYAETSVSQRASRPEGRMVRGLARLGVGDLAGAREDLEVALAAGISRNEILRRAGVIALRAGHEEFAREQLQKLFIAHEYSYGIPTMAALGAFDTAGVPQDAVEFIETFRPQIALGDGVAGANLTSALSQMFEAAGQHDRAFDVYLDAMRQLSLDDPFNTQLATYRNNLAYTFSTTAENVGVGVPFVLQAIAHGNRREASYIDTLGWLYYRQGKLAEAEAEIRRALRSSAGSVGNLGELYEHLAAIEAARGYHGKSVWMQIFADSVEPVED